MAHAVANSEYDLENSLFVNLDNGLNVIFPKDHTRSLETNFLLYREGGWDSLEEGEDTVVLNIEKDGAFREVKLTFMELATVMYMQAVLETAFANGATGPDELEYYFANGITDQQIADILHGLACFAARAPDGTPRLDLLRERFLEKFGGLNVPRRFCKHLIGDYQTQIDGEFLDVEKDSVALKDFKRGIRLACFPPEQTKDNSLKYQLMLEGPYKEHFDVLTRLFPLLMPDVFQCEKRLGIPKGHIYLAVFESKLFKLADFLLENIEAIKLGDDYIDIKNILSQEDLKYLKKTLCDYTSSSKKEVKNKSHEYLRRIFPNETCE